ncbi:hypothetical protein BGZ94_007476 [Podila epigama]|nr:hypothetical protein BGZ94_007476 [Podila epigama]
MDPRKLKVQELKDQLQLAGLSVAGKKDELVARLLEHQKVEEEVAATVADAGPLTGSGEGFEWDDSKYDDLAPPSETTETTTTTTKAASSTTASDGTATAPASTSNTTTTSTSATTKGATGTHSSSITTTTTTTSSTTPSVEFKGAPGEKSAEVLKAEYEKRKNRAARFGIPLKEEDKAVERAARFGVPVTAKATASLAKTTLVPTTASTVLPAKPGSVKTQISDEVLKKRAERFGIQATTTTTTSTTKSSTTTTTAGTKHSLYTLDAAEEEKKRKRAAKFGAAP